MKVTISCVGKIKENYYVNAIKEYSKRLSRYCRLDIIEVPDEKTPANASPADEEIIKGREGSILIRHFSENAKIIALAIEGKPMSSVEFASYIDKSGIEGSSHLQFVIGGSLGLSDEVLKRADCKISFSNMTFPHQLMRVILLEQIYRSYRIINNEPYHK